MRLGGVLIMRRGHTEGIHLYEESNLPSSQPLIRVSRTRFIPVVKSHDKELRCRLPGTVVEQKSPRCSRTIRVNLEQLIVCCGASKRQRSTTRSGHRTEARSATG